MKPQRQARSLLTVLMALLTLSWGSAQAQLTIEISGGAEAALPIAVVPFAWNGPSGEAPVDIAEVIIDDLERSGRFAAMRRNQLIARPSSFDQVNSADWRLTGSEALVIGNIQLLPQRRARVRFELIDVPRGSLIKSRLFDISLNQLRQVGHHIADLVYEAMTGQRGAFNTRIAYVTASPPRGRAELYELKIADADGYNEHRILSSKEPLLSPAWSPDGQQLAYVSFETGRPEIWVHNIATGQRRSVAKWKRLNSAPAWSPDGKRLAVSLSRDGNPEIYILELASGALTRLTNSSAIDTEPAWMPDGNSLLFTSNRGGGPQLYRVSRRGGRPTRVSFEGDYNAAASVAPDGKRVAMVHRESGAYKIAVMNLDSGSVDIISSGRMDESPSFSPNGQMIVFASERSGGASTLNSISVGGNAQQRLSHERDSAREPAWAPFGNQ